MHLISDYLLDEEQGVWGVNLEEFRSRLGSPEVKNRVENLYFAYLFVLRAVMKAAPLLKGYEYETGLPQEDEQTRRMVAEIVSTTGHCLYLCKWLLAWRLGCHRECCR